VNWPEKGQVMIACLLEVPAAQEKFLARRTRNQ
jgi:hypothetical protein